MSLWKFIIRICVLLVFAGCSPDKTTLDIDGGYENGGGGHPGGLLSIAALKSMYLNRPVTVNTEITVRGRLVSSDRWGNFYKTLYLEDESAGIAIRVDMEEYFRSFRFGDILTVYCNTLTLGTYGGAIQLGILAGGTSNDIGYIPGDYLLSSVTVAPAAEEPRVTSVTIPGLVPSHIGRYVEIDGVQFEGWDNELRWCDDDSDTNRVIIDADGNRLDVRTSRYAEFASEVVPGGSGFIRGVVGYFNGSYQLTVLNGTYAVMEDERF